MEGDFVDQRGTVFMYTFKWKSKVQNSTYGILVFVKKKVKNEFIYLLEYTWNISRKDLLATGEENRMVGTWGWEIDFAVHPSVPFEFGIIWMQYMHINDQNFK